MRGLSKSLRALFLALAMLFTSSNQWLRTGTASPREAEREVWLGPQNKNYPVVITGITLGDVEVQGGRYVRSAAEAPDPISPFMAGDDWVQRLAIHLYNRTNKTIVYATVWVTFPETQTSPNQRRGYPITLGQLPAAANFTKDGREISRPAQRGPLAFRPRQTMTIALRDYVDDIKSNVEPVLLLSATTKVVVDLNVFVFEDGMQWGGVFRTPDKQNFTWKRLDPDFFPGEMNTNWPAPRSHINQ